ncbi:MAG TPA: hypothetical protein VF486_01155 [Actinomycetes bacterium]
MNERDRDEVRTADLADDRRDDMMGPNRDDERPGDVLEPDRTDREAGLETRDEGTPARDSWAREKLAQAREKLAQGPAATVHREDTTRLDDEPARDQDLPTEPPLEPDRSAVTAREPDRPEVTAPRMAPNGDSADTGAAVGPLLAADDAEAFRARWTDVQNGFVDAPRQAVERADGLTAELMQHLAGSFADERARLERQWDRGDEVSTDSLRSAFQRYRSFFERLLATCGAPPRRAATRRPPPPGRCLVSSLGGTPVVTMRRPLLVVPLVLLLGACTGPVRSSAVYESKAGETAKVVGSAVETARLAVDASTGRKAYGRYLTQVLLDAEEDATAAQGTFDGIQPPDRRADQLRDSLDKLLDEATSTLAALRTAARRGHLGELRGLAGPLPKLSARLGDFAEAHA